MDPRQLAAAARAASDPAKAMSSPDRTTIHNKFGIDVSMTPGEPKAILVALPTGDLHVFPVNDKTAADVGGALLRPREIVRGNGGQ